MDRRKKHELRKESLEKVRGEIQAERAAALARITRTLERHLTRLEHLRREIPGVAGSQRTDLIAGYEALRGKAQRWRWYLKVQREVNHLFDGDTLDESYPIPGPIED